MGGRPAGVEKRKSERLELHQKCISTYLGLRGQMYPRRPGFEHRQDWFYNTRILGLIPQYRKRHVIGDAAVIGGLR